MEQRFLKNYKVCVSRSERASERVSYADGTGSKMWALWFWTRWKVPMTNWQSSASFTGSIYHFKNTVIINIFMCKLIILFIYLFLWKTISVTKIRFYKSSRVYLFYFLLEDNVKRDLWTFIFIYEILNIIILH